ncbi:MAG TPA: transposase [Gaiellales bacterium]|jgi:REP element-mobilizing transposase RayT
MARRKRIDYPGALQHVAVKGNNQQSMFVDAIDRFALLTTLRVTAERYGWEVLSYCLMDTHWHLLVRTPRTLSIGMQRLNSCYSRGFNERHARTGHSLRHKFMSVPVEDDAHLRELTRYIPLNPVRAGLAPTAELWPWSSYLHELGAEPAPDWLNAGWATRLHGSAERLRSYVEAGSRDPVAP